MSELEREEATKARLELRAVIEKVVGECLLLEVADALVVGDDGP